MLNAILAYLDTQKQTVIDIQRGLVSIPALSPEVGGEGERKKADHLKKYLADIGITDIREINAPDPRVPCGHRPNMIAVIPGKDVSRTFWNVCHLDVVPPGDAARWRHYGNAEPTGEPSQGIGKVEMESGFDPAVKAELKLRGYAVVPGTGAFGGFEAILFDAKERVYAGATEMRKDGEVAGY